VGGGLAVFDQALGFRRMAPDGSVATLGGRRPFGSTDGPAAQARFFGMRGVAVDARGDIYLADAINGTIRKVSAGGDVSTFAGRAQLSALPLDGVGPAARFMRPSNMVVDASGTLHVVDFRSIRQISPQAEVRTLLALPEGTDLPERPCDSAQSSVTDLAVDASGTLYYTDPEQHIICKITPQGEALLVAGTVGQPGSTDGAGPAARFFRPSHLAVDAEGALYVSDAGNETVRKISAAGDVSTVAGRAGQRGAADGVGSNARFSSPGDLVIASDGSVYVADTRNRAVRRLATDGTVSTFTRAVGPLTAPILGLFSPTALAIGPGGQLYIADEAQDVLWRAQLP
jgi:DNA-binding beta-propeller fold protein YncE